jgi:hypothetical protein
MIAWPKPQKRLPYMGDPFFYGDLCSSTENGERTGIRIACYVRAPPPNPTLGTAEIVWILDQLMYQGTEKGSRKAIRCLRCQEKETADVWFLRLEQDLGGPWCSKCLDSKVRQDLGLDAEVDEGNLLYLVHINKKFLTEVAARKSFRPSPSVALDIDPRTLF